MPKYISERGPVGICDRCRFKFPLGKLKPDRDKPSLRVCADCNDEPDPYKLPPAKAERINLPFARPEEPLVMPEDVESQE